MKRKILIAILVVAVIVGVGAWYYFSHPGPTNISKILQNPGEYSEKVVSLEGEVTDRTAFFSVLKFFKVRDKTGEIIVVTKKSLPEVKSTVLVKGRINDAFQIGDQKLTVFNEESFEEESKK